MQHRLSLQPVLLSKPEIGSVRSSEVPACAETVWLSIISAFVYGARDAGRWLRHALPQRHRPAEQPQVTPSKAERLNILFNRMAHSAERRAWYPPSTYGTEKSTSLGSISGLRRAR
jgi:hypothetical protein